MTFRKPSMWHGHVPALVTALARALLPTLIMFVVGEVVLRAAYLGRNFALPYVPLPYVIGDDYGPVPPWVDSLRMFEPDEVLMWHNRPNLRRRYLDVFSPVDREEQRTALLRDFIPVIPEPLRGSAVWEVALNSEGFRDGEFQEEKPASTFRIVCLGDSWTFGSNVGQGHSYPRQLQWLLGQKFLGAHFEVFNMGVLGYVSYQGKELLKRRVVALQPDLLVAGFAMNEPHMSGAHGGAPIIRRSLLQRLFENLETLKLLRFWALRLNYRPVPMEQHFKEKARQVGWVETVAADEAQASWFSGALKEYEGNMLELVHVARQHGAETVLLRNELWDSPYRAVLEDISRAEGVILIDAGHLIAAERSRIEAEIEAQFNLHPPTTSASRADDVEVVFRVYTGDRPIRNGVYITGPHSQLGALVPNKIGLHDDGTMGDQRAGDKVWSYTATFSPGTRVFYVYTIDGREGQWEGLDVPDIRWLDLPADGPAKVYRPIESFGKIYLQADPWHTDARGYELIAGAVLEATSQNRLVINYLNRIMRQ